VGCGFQTIEADECRRDENQDEGVCTTCNSTGLRVCQALLRQTLFDIKCCDAVLLSGLTIALPAEPNRRRTLFPRWELLKEEADETIYWIELLIDAELVKRERVMDLLDESNQLLSIAVTSIKTARAGKTPGSAKSAVRNPQSEIV